MSTDLSPVNIPLGDFSPDLGQMVDVSSGGYHLMMAGNVWPLGAQGYAPVGELESMGVTTPRQSTGSLAFDSQFLYTGLDDGTIHEVDFDADTSTAQWAAGGFPTGKWSFVRFGDTVVAAQSEAKLLKQESRGGSFALLVTQGSGVPINAQDETRYDSSPASEGSFAGGTGHAAGDVVTLEDGTTVTVDAESGGVVTQFTVNSSGSNGISVSIGGTLSQQSTTGSGTGFSITLQADNYSSGLQPRYVETFRERIIVANIKTTETTALGAAGEYPYTIFWSGRQAANNFDPANAALRSSFVTLPTQWGVITGLAEVGDGMLIFFEQAIYRMTPVDGLLPYTFGFDPVVVGTGTVHPRSIFSFGAFAGFWGPTGPAIASLTEMREIGTDKMSTTLLSPRWPTSVEINLDPADTDPQILGALSAPDNSMLWRYPPEDDDYSDAILVWNYVTQRFSVILFRKTGSIDNQIRLLESRPGIVGGGWGHGSSIVLGSKATSGSTTYKTFSSATGSGSSGDASEIGPARFQMAYVELMQDLLCRPTHFMVVASPPRGATGSMPTVSVTVNSKITPMAATTSDKLFTYSAVSTDTDYDDTGWMGLEHDDSGSAVVTPQNGRFHQFDVEVTPNSWTPVEFQAFRVRIGTGGYW